MHVLIVHAHPEPASFNGAMTDAARAALLDAGHDVVVSDLYADGFNALAGRHDFTTVADATRFHYQSEQAHAAAHDAFCDELKREQARLHAADVLILQFPIWQGAPPAIMKGWFDRVLAYGVTYVDGRRFDTGFFKGRVALMGVTTGGTPQRFSPEGVYGEIERVLWPVQRLTLEYLGFTVKPPFVAYGAPRVSDEERAAYLRDWARLVVETVNSAPQAEKIDPRAAMAEVGAGAWTRK